MAWTDYHKNLVDILAGLIQDKDDARRIVMNAGLDPAMIAWKDRPKSYWFSIVEEAEKRGMCQKVAEAAYKEVQNPDLLAASKGPDVATPVHTEEPIDWRSNNDASSLEKLMGKENNLLPVSFLEEGLKRAKPVCRIVRKDGMLGTGFLVGESLVATNNHVLPNKDIARDAIMEFNYEREFDGLEKQPVSYATDVDKTDSDKEGFRTDVENDISLVRTEKAPGKEYGIIEVAAGSLKIGDRVSIIQHPGGLFKQIAMHNNRVTYVDENIVQYLTDTLPGSSGAPVFNHAWELVAIHHSGGWIREPGMERPVFRNEGMSRSHLQRAIQEFGL